LHVRAAQPRVNREEVRGGELGSGFGIVRRVSAHRVNTALVGRKDDASSPRRIRHRLLRRVPLAGPGVEAQAGDRTHHIGVVEARRRKGADKVQRWPRYGEQAAQKDCASHGARYRCVRRVVAAAKLAGARAVAVQFVQTCGDNAHIWRFQFVET
jgi:hypothetical protein